MKASQWCLLVVFFCLCFHVISTTMHKKASLSFVQRTRALHRRMRVATIRGADCCDVRPLYGARYVTLYVLPRRDKLLSSYYSLCCVVSALKVGLIVK